MDSYFLKEKKNYFKSRGIQIIISKAGDYCAFVQQMTVCQQAGLKSHTGT